MIIFINGSINAGKSTIANILAKKLPNIALIEIDTLREMIGWMPLEESIPINLENAVSLIENFSRKGLDVIVAYPLAQKSYDYMSDKLKDSNQQIYFFTLSPNLEKALTNRGARELNDWEKNRIKHHYDRGIHKPNFGEIIDNSEQNPEETAKIILDKINQVNTC
jgi:adenylate kinase family enzyme